MKKTKKKGCLLLVLVVLFLTVGLYTLLFFYGRSAIVPRNNALVLIRQANDLFKEVTASATLTEEIALGEKYISLYEQANAINLKQYPLLGNYPILEGYIQQNLQLWKEIVQYTKDVQSQTVHVTQADFDKKGQEFNKRIIDIQNTYGSYGRTQLWMKLVFLQ